MKSSFKTQVSDAFKLTMIGMLGGMHYSLVRPEEFCSYNCGELASSSTMTVLKLSYTRPTGGPSSGMLSTFER